MCAYATACRLQGLPYWSQCAFARSHSCVLHHHPVPDFTDAGSKRSSARELGSAKQKAKQNPKLAGWFVGQVMKATGGKANPKAVNDLVAAKLGL